ncbi:MAG: MurR/RpiR family transcriptional regulator [Aggregatibacter sp.]|jgi:uncharacterized HTH-type transcriptional regulator HI_0143|nr:MurR/RpiR family transcriptional regulator [uncultured Aggregatibacter sp.]
MVRNGNVLNSISSLYQSLTKTEKKIADVITQSPNVVTQYSLAQLAERLDVGEATLVRFCRTLGFKGFSDFKLAFSIDLAKTREGRDDTVLETEILPNDDSQTIAHKLQSAINAVMDETINLLDFHQLEVVVEAIRSANKVFLFGVGSSGVTAEEAKNKLMRIGMQVDASGNNHFMYMQVALLRKNDVAIGISHSGYSQETAHALKIAKENGATTVALTHSMRSPLTEHADFVLVNGNKQGKLQGDSIGTKTAQLFVLDLIYALLVQAEQDKAIKTKEKTLNVILEQRIKY